MVAEPSESRHLQLSVRDFGPIAEADIDLRPMTVFVGPNNTGKSYLAILVYALHQFFAGDLGMASFRRRGLFSWPRQWPSVGAVGDEAVEDVITWLKQFESSERPVGFQAPMPASVASYVLSSLQITQDAGNTCMEEILRCFGRESVNRLVRHGSQEEARVVISCRVTEEPEAQGTFEYQFLMGKEKTDFRSIVPDRIPPKMATQIGISAYGYYQQFNRHIVSTPEDAFLKGPVFGLLSSLTNSLVVKPLNGSVHYLPADRTGIMHAHRLVVRSLVRGTSWAGIRPEEPLPVLSGVTGDFLDTLIALEDAQDRRSPFGDNLAARLEKNILAGSIVTRFSAIGYPEFYYRPNGWDEDIPLMNTSSMVSELAPVVLYLQNIIEEGELLIIEEPESHLHPAMQVEFVRHLAAAVRAGIRVIITTHSEWVLEELANLAHLSNLPESQRDGIGGAEYALTPEELGIWLFGSDKKSGGSIVGEVRFNPEDGGFVTDYEDVAIRTHNDWARITNRLSELDTE